LLILGEALGEQLRGLDGPGSDLDFVEKLMNKFYRWRNELTIYINDRTIRSTEKQVETCQMKYVSCDMADHM
jgi:hypothetical protein